LQTLATDWQIALNLLQLIFTEAFCRSRRSRGNNPTPLLFRRI